MMESPEPEHHNGESHGDPDSPEPESESGEKAFKDGGDIHRDTLEDTDKHDDNLDNTQQPTPDGNSGPLDSDEEKPSMDEDYAIQNKEQAETDLTQNEGPEEDHIVHQKEEIGDQTASDVEETHVEEPSDTSPSPKEDEQEDSIHSPEDASGESQEGELAPVKDDDEASDYEAEDPKYNEEEKIDDTFPKHEEIPPETDEASKDDTDEMSASSDKEDDHVIDPEIEEPSRDNEEKVDEVLPSHEETPAETEEASDEKQRAESPFPTKEEEDRDLDAEEPKEDQNGNQEEIVLVSEETKPDAEEANTGGKEDESPLPPKEEDMDSADKGTVELEKEKEENTNVILPAHDETASETEGDNIDDSQETPSPRPPKEEDDEKLDHLVEAPIENQEEEINEVLPTQDEIEDQETEKSHADDEPMAESSLEPIGDQEDADPAEELGEDKDENPDEVLQDHQEQATETGDASDVGRETSPLPPNQEDEDTANHGIEEPRKDKEEYINIDVLPVDNETGPETEAENIDDEQETAASPLPSKEEDEEERGHPVEPLMEDQEEDTHEMLPDNEEPATATGEASDETSLLPPAHEDDVELGKEVEEQKEDDEEQVYHIPSTGEETEQVTEDPKIDDQQESSMESKEEFEEGSDQLPEEPRKEQDESQDEDRPFHEEREPEREERNEDQQQDASSLPREDEGEDIHHGGRQPEEDPEDPDDILPSHEGPPPEPKEDPTEDQERDVPSPLKEEVEEEEAGHAGEEPQKEVQEEDAHEISPTHSPVKEEVEGLTTISIEETQEKDFKLNEIHPSAEEPSHDEEMSASEDRDVERQVEDLPPPSTVEFGEEQTHNVEESHYEEPVQTASPPNEEKYPSAEIAGFPETEKTAEAKLEQNEPEEKSPDVDFGLTLDEKPDLETTPVIENEKESLQEEEEVEEIIDFKEQHDIECAPPISFSDDIAPATETRTFDSELKHESHEPVHPETDSNFIDFPVQPDSAELGGTDYSFAGSYKMSHELGDLESREMDDEVHPVVESGTRIDMGTSLETDYTTHDTLERPDNHILGGQDLSLELPMSDGAEINLERLSELENAAITQNNDISDDTNAPNLEEDIVSSFREEADLENSTPDLQNLSSVQEDQSESFPVVLETERAQDTPGYLPISTEKENLEEQFTSSEEFNSPLESSLESGGEFKMAAIESVDMYEDSLPVIHRVTEPIREQDTNGFDTEVHTICHVENESMNQAVTEEINGASEIESARRDLEDEKEVIKITEKSEEPAFVEESFTVTKTEVIKETVELEDQKTIIDRPEHFTLSDKTEVSTDEGECTITPVPTDQTPEKASDRTGFFSDSNYSPAEKKRPMTFTYDKSFIESDTESFTTRGRSTGRNSQRQNVRSASMHGILDTYARGMSPKPYNRDLEIFHVDSKSASPELLESHHTSPHKVRPVSSIREEIARNRKKFYDTADNFKPHYSWADTDNINVALEKDAFTNSLPRNAKFTLQKTFPIDIDDLVVNGNVNGTHEKTPTPSENEMEVDEADETAVAVQEIESAPPIKKPPRKEKEGNTGQEQVYIEDTLNRRGRDKTAGKDRKQKEGEKPSKRSRSLAEVVRSFLTCSPHTEMD